MSERHGKYSEWRSLPPWQLWLDIIAHIYLQFEARLTSYLKEEIPDKYNDKMSGTVTVFVTSPDTRSERRFDQHITVKQLKVLHL